MDKDREKQQQKRRKKKGGILSGSILVIALAVFCISAFQLIKYGKGYLAGRSEYSGLRQLSLEGEQPGGDFQVNFDDLSEINPDTVGWIRFYPEPSAINYPIVQGKNNQEYLNKTFAQEENTTGAIFMAAENRANLFDKNTIIYGHRMDDHSMFYHLEDYQDQGFYKKYPHFYIYTPDGIEHVYRIYSAGIVDESSDTYMTSFSTSKKFKEFLKMTKETSDYDTGVEVGADSRIVTLSTCTSASDSNRYVVHGVLEDEVKVKGKEKE